MTLGVNINCDSNLYLWKSAIFGGEFMKQYVNSHQHKRFHPHKLLVQERPYIYTPPIHHTPASEFKVYHYIYMVSSSRKRTLNYETCKIASSESFSIKEPLQIESIQIEKSLENRAHTKNQLCVWRASKWHNIKATATNDFLPCTIQASSSITWRELCGLSVKNSYFLH